MRAQKIEPSGEADRRTLLRRLSLDLIGLPPTPDETAKYLQNSGGRSYEQQVDRLLQSPHFGERMAVWWLDVARFTDTVGFHGDQNQRIFPYRDYVIEAFNANKPFDQFTIEQLAGDLLPNPTTEQLVATGFNRLNMMTREGGAQSKEYLAKYGAERVRTIGSTWLGSTLTCVECHDHKYDPFTARDFYSMQAFFADIKQWGVYSDYGYTPEPELRGWSNDHPFPPELEVASPFLQRRLGRLEEQLDSLLAASRQSRQGEAAKGAYDEWIRATRAFLQSHADGWETPPAVAEVVERRKPSEKTKAVVTPEQIVRYSAKPAKREELHVVLQPQSRQVAAVRVELVPDAAGEAEAITKLPRQIVRVAAAIRSADGKERSQGFYFADADKKEPRYASTVEMLGVTEGWLTAEKHAGEKQTSVWLLHPPVELAKGESLVVTLRADQSLVPVRMGVSPLAARQPLDVGNAESRAALEAEKPTATQQNHLDELYLLSVAADADAFASYVKLQRQMAECRGGKAWTMVTAATAKPLQVRVLPRGNWLDESGAIVAPATPGFLPDISNEEGRRLTRLDLARWLCSADNPLTARTVVNRLWKQFFGNALSAVVDDLGAQGEPPSHPELLDWLAVEFRESGWNIKHLIKLMVMSQTYRQSSNLRRELWEIDPANRLLASQNPRRLDAEFVRDNALAIAGLLNRELGGPSVKPYQPADYYANLQFPDRPYVATSDAGQWRRGVYVHWQRTFLHPMLANFDAQAREECIANRVTSNTPQQALTLLNDVEFVEAARVLAQRLLTEPADGDAARLDRALELALARPAKPRERESLLAFLTTQREYFRANGGEAEKFVKAGTAPAIALDPAEHAAWMSVARVILNMHETITRY